MLHKISLEQKDNSLTYKLLVDDKDVSNVANRVKFDLTPDSLPVIEIKYHGLLNYHGEAKVKFSIDDAILSLASKEDIQDIIDKWKKMHEGETE